MINDIQCEHLLSIQNHSSYRIYWPRKEIYILQTPPNIRIFTSCMLDITCQLNYCRYYMTNMNAIEHARTARRGS